MQYKLEINTILPPNSPVCSRGDVENDGNYRWEPAILSPSSFHTGGVNAALADGSVHFISDTIEHGSDLTIEACLWSPSGKSPWGVWGALGTASQGDNALIP